MVCPKSLPSIDGISLQSHAQTSRFRPLQKPQVLFKGVKVPSENAVANCKT